MMKHSPAATQYATQSSLLPEIAELRGEPVRISRCFQGASPQSVSPDQGRQAMFMCNDGESRKTVNTGAVTVRWQRNVEISYGFRTAGLKAGSELPTVFTLDLRKCFNELAWQPLHPEQATVIQFKRRRFSLWLLGRAGSQKPQAVLARV